MKRSIFITALSCLFLLTCQTNTEELNTTEESKDQTNSLARSASPITPIQETLLFKDRLQWTAYIAGKIFLNNETARNEVAALLVNKRVDLDRLIGANAVAPTFASAFEFELRIYMLTENSNRTEIEEDRPPSGISTCCTNGEDIDVLTWEFLDFMTVDHCAELYFPNKLITHESIKLVHTTGHPLNKNESNYGYSRTHNYNDGNARLTTIHNSFSSTYTKYGTLILARPLGDAKSCDYSYIMSDFTLFLD